MKLAEMKQIADATQRGILNYDASANALRNDCSMCLRALNAAIAELEKEG